MKRISLSPSKALSWLILGTTCVGLGLSCGSDSSRIQPVAPSRVAPQSESAGPCSAPLFGMGRPMAISELANAEAMKLELREVHFRGVLSRRPGDVELAYRVEMRMQLAADRFLVPVHTLACNEENRPSPRARRLSRTMIPVLGDLHLPSTRVTVFDQASSESDLYNYPRISEITVSNGAYFSFNQNWTPYRQIRTIGQYLNLLRYRALYQKVELREMGDGWIGIYAEKDIGGETAQLMILLSRAN